MAGDEIKIKEAHVVADVGIALDPRNIERQIEGSFLFGLSAASLEKITVFEGKVQQSNFDTYSILKMNQTPEMNVAFIESGERIFGVGEAGTPVAAPALGNAIFAATGKRIRELPFGDHFTFV